VPLFAPQKVGAPTSGALVRLEQRLEWTTFHRGEKSVLQDKSLRLMIAKCRSILGAFGRIADQMNMHQTVLFFGAPKNGPLERCDVQVGPLGFRLGVRLPKDPIS